MQSNDCSDYPRTDFGNPLGKAAMVGAGLKQRKTTILQDKLRIHLSTRPIELRGLRLCSARSVVFLSNVAGRVVSAEDVQPVFGVPAELLKNCIELLREPDKVERVSAS